MPQVPIYNGPQVREQALQPVFQREVDVSSGLQAMGRGLQQVSEVIDRRVERDAATEANEADANITAQWLQWEADNRPKFTGKNAEGFTAEANKWWDKVRDDYGKQLSPLAKQRLSETLTRKRGAALGSVIQFVGQEKQRHFVSVTEEAAKRAAEMGAATGATAVSALEVRKLAEDLSKQLGWEQPQKDGWIQGHLDAMHGARIGRLANTDAPGAQKLLEEAISRGELSPIRSAQLREAVESAAKTQTGVQQARALAALPYAERLKKAAEEKDPAIRAAMEQTIDQDEARIQRANREAVGQLAGGLRLELERTGRLPPADLKRLEALDPGAAADLIKAQKADQKARLAEAQGKPIKTDFAAWHDAYQKIRAGQPVDLNQYRDRISLDDLQKLAQTKTDFGNPTKQDDLYSKAQRVEKALVGLKVDPKKDPETAYRFMDEVDRRIRAESAAKGGRNLTGDELDKIVDGIAKDKVYVPGFLSATEKPQVMLEGDEARDAFVVVDGRNVKVSSVPASDRMQIMQALRAEGLPVTEQAIVTYYLKAQRERANRTVPAAQGGVPAPMSATAPAAPVRSSALSLGTPTAPPLEQPSIYASQEEWARYRAAQAAAQK